MRRSLPCVRCQKAFVWKRARTILVLSPGAVDSELKEGSSDEASSRNVKEFYKIAVPADSVARAIAYAIEQPADVEIDEIVVRPTVQEF